MVVALVSSFTVPRSSPSPSSSIFVSSSFRSVFSVFTEISSAAFGGAGGSGFIAFCCTGVDLRGAIVDGVVRMDPCEPRTAGVRIRGMYCFDKPDGAGVWESSFSGVGFAKEDPVAEDPGGLVFLSKKATRSLERTRKGSEVTTDDRIIDRGRKIICSAVIFGSL